MRSVNNTICTLVLVSCSIAVANGWCPSAKHTFSTQRRQSLTVLSMSSTTEEDVSKMRLSEIKSELQDRKIDFSDCFDKESMVAKLTEARANNIDNSNDDVNDESDDEETSSNETKESSSPSEDFDREKALAELQGMRVRELREELGRRRISRAGLFEKEDLVNALLEARAIASVFSGTGLLTPGEVAELMADDVQKEMDHPGSLLLLDVYATWCGPCQMIAPFLKEIAAEEGDQLRIVKMDSDKNQELAGKLRVSGLPTLVLFEGGTEIDRLEGAPSKEQLKGWINSKR